MSTMRSIYGLRKELGLDDETARALYQRETGKRSLREMSPGEQVRVQPELLALAEVGFDRGAGGDAAQDRQRHQFRPPGAGQADAALLVRHQLDHPRLGQGQDVLLRGIARGEAEGLGDLGEAGRLPGRDPAPDEGEDLGALERKFGGHGGHLYTDWP